MVKCSVPYAPILQFFIEVCGFLKLLDFAEEKISLNNKLFKLYIYNIKERIKDYKCGKTKSSLKGILCGYFKTLEYEPVKKGKVLPYLGEVKEERYILPINELKWKREDWEYFLLENNINSLS
ncbi:MAG: hypothetical protein N2312_01430 [Dictyoglomaceae bacterium]|nr:hypothetical protein [Dictyoglomaceae bacterium]